MGTKWVLIAGAVWRSVVEEMGERAHLELSVIDEASLIQETLGLEGRKEFQRWK